MHRNNRHSRTGTADSGRHLHAVADSRGQQEAPSAEDKVRDALTRHPGSTAAAVAKAAEVGRSTAGKILARWGGDGTAIRTTGDGPRDPDTWLLAAPDCDTVPSDADGVLPDVTKHPSVDATVEHASDAADTSTDDTATDAKASDANPDGQNAENAAATEDAAEPEVADNEAPAQSDTDRTEPPPATAPSPDKADEAEPPAATLAASGTADPARSDNGRLSKGALRALVEEYLTDHPGESFGPAQIGKDLSRSGGAVNNACEKLVADGYAIKTCEAPKRFTINPDKTDVPATTENATTAG